MKRGHRKPRCPPCVDESTRDALSYSNNIVSQFGLGCNRKFVDGKEKTGTAPFKLNRERSLRNGYES